ncbi:MAG: S24/S26 family peptidase [Solobacterium sp.]|nr:S24/S26 family peptidase [Solobacterium sp.]
MNTPISIEEELNRSGKIVYKIKGHSMYPMLRQEKDLVVIKKNTGIIHPGDVVLYKRAKDNALVLHRVIKINEDHLVIRGDHTLSNEKVHASQIIGLLESYIRNNKAIVCGSLPDKLYRLTVPILRFLYCLKYRIFRYLKKQRNS